MHFLETLHALAGRVAGTDLPSDEEFFLHDRLIQRLPKVWTVTTAATPRQACPSMNSRLLQALTIFLTACAQDDIPPKYSVGGETNGQRSTFHLLVDCCVIVSCRGVMAYVTYDVCIARTRCHVSDETAAALLGYCCRLLCRLVRQVFHKGLLDT